MREEICPSNLCTACGACENICPKSCVVRESGDSSFSMKRGDDCVHCDLCAGVCPVENDVELNQPTKAFAGWSTDQHIRRSSASGGIATSIYKYAANNGIYFVGAALDENFECRLQLCSKDEEVYRFQNSKYTYSFADLVYKQVDEKLSSGLSVVFIGLPCQIAGLRSFIKIKNHSQDNLLCVDIICHGTPKPEYLQHHIQALSKQYEKRAETCHFRDERYGTHNFIYSLYTGNEELPFYKKSVEEDDLYQIGYHNALIYRDACYSCKFAQIKRGGDITIGDFHVWDVDSCDIDIENVSTILINTEKGQRFIQKLEVEKYLKLLERPLEESINGEKQLRHPSVAGPERELLLSEYAKIPDYEKAASIAFAGIIRRRRLKIDAIKNRIKKTIKLFVPRKLWLALKKKYKRV